MSDQDLLRMDDVALEAATSRLSGYIADLQNENESLLYIHKYIPNHWNEGETVDVDSYRNILGENIVTIDTTIIPTLQDYVNTMITLIAEIRAAKRRAYEAAARAKAASSGHSVN